MTETNEAITKAMSRAYPPIIMTIDGDGDPLTDFRYYSRLWCRQSLG